MCFWVYAGNCYCVLENTELRDGNRRQTYYYKRHLQHFRGKRIPFGAAVWFRPGKTGQINALPKPHHRLIAGIFLGYKICTGGIWRNE